MFRQIRWLKVPRTAGVVRSDALRGRPSVTRRRVGNALLATLLALGAGAAAAQPFFAGRMSPEERERLRRELRQQPERGRQDGVPGYRRERMSPVEREQLRRQLREASPDERRGRGRRRD